MLTSFSVQDATTHPPANTPVLWYYRFSETEVLAVVASFKMYRNLLDEVFPCWEPTGIDGYDFECDLHSTNIIGWMPLPTLPEGTSHA